LRRLLPLLLAGALAGVTSAPAAAQNMCSPSTATANRYAGYPSSAPYSNSSTRITSNCTGPNVDPGITPDPYAGMAFPVPGYVYGSPSGAPVIGGYTALGAPGGASSTGPAAMPGSYPAAAPPTSTDPSAYASSSPGSAQPSAYASAGAGTAQPSAVDPSTLNGAGSAASSPGGYPPSSVGGYGPAAGYPGYSGPDAVAAPGYPVAGPYGIAGYGYPGPYATGYGYPAAPYGVLPGGFPGYPYPGYFGR